MLAFQNISRYTDYFEDPPPLALAAVNSHAREGGERHPGGGVRGCNVAPVNREIKHTFKVDSSKVARLDLALWRVERQRDYPLHIGVYFSGTESLDDITTWAYLSQRLSESWIEHTFGLDVGYVESLLPFTELLKRAEEVYRRECLVTSLEPLPGLERLRSVGLSSCRGALDLDHLSNCSNLTRVNISFCDGVTSTETLGRLPHLRDVALASFDITSVDFLKGCQALESVSVSYYMDLISLVGLSGLGKLRSVNANNSGITDVLGLAGCAALETVDVRSCAELASLDGLSGLPTVKSVFANMSGIMTVGGLADCAALETVDVGDCASSPHWMGYPGCQT
ncbi:hypothetical protein ADEAN_000933900 [Angomonas deanei]|uniref:Uncharacterized protein n=1 Tax=Angomonas deanei TaxID=59799 RepID=A0A7G2CS50_9TRYP|nr:hypothetical protein ADEAN_000933900 [Angomonas deanei]